MQLQEVEPLAYSKVWYSVEGLESEGNIQTRVIGFIG